MEVEMNALLVVCLATSSPFAGLVFYNMQTKLERWAQERHAMD